MRVWILQTGEPLPCDGGSARPMRAMNLTRALNIRKHHVVIWSSGFYHQEKRHRTTRFERIIVNNNLEVRLIPSVGYKVNIGLGRLFDHAQLAMRLKQLLRHESELPDVAFIGYPPIEMAAVMAVFLKKANVPFIVDVKDQWPTIFIDRLPSILKSVGKFVLYPYFALGRRAMSDANGLVSMSQGFLGWSREFSRRLPSDFDGVFPLSPGKVIENPEEISRAEEWWDQNNVLRNGIHRFIFVGSMSPSFDFLPIKHAALRCLEEGIACQFVLCGTGSEETKVRSMMLGIANVIMPGWINQPKIAALSSRSSASLAPYISTEDFKLSIPNKILDALSVGLPVITSLEGELSNLIAQYDIGLIYDPRDGESLYRAIENFISIPHLRDDLSVNAKNLFSNRFDGEMVYGNLVAEMERLYDFSK